MATTGDKVRAKCIVIPIETCDEGFEHIQSDIGKRLGGGLEYELTDTLEDDKFWYNSSLTIDDDAVDMISGNYVDATGSATSDAVRFIFVRNLSATCGVYITLVAGASQRIYLNPNESVAFKTSGVYVGGVHISNSLDGDSTTVEVLAVCNDVA